MMFVAPKMKPMMRPTPVGVVSGGVGEDQGERDVLPPIMAPILTRKRQYVMRQEDGGMVELRLSKVEGPWAPAGIALAGTGILTSRDDPKSDKLRIIDASSLPVFVRYAQRLELRATNVEKCLAVTCEKDNDGLRWLTESSAPLWPEMQRETQGTVALSLGILLVCCDPTSLSRKPFSSLFMILCIFDGSSPTA